MSNQNLNEQTASSKNKGYRVFAILIAALSLIALFLPIKTFAGDKVSTHISFALLGQMFASPYKKWGFIPMLGDPASATTRLGSYAVICFIVAMLVVLAVAIVAIVLSAKDSSAKKTQVFATIAVYAFTLASAVYSLVITTVTSYVPNTVIVIDVTTVALTAIGCILYLFLLIQKYQAGSLFYVVQFVCSFAVLAFAILAFTHDSAAVFESLQIAPRYKVFAMLFILGMTTVVGFASLCAFYPNNKKASNVISVSILFFQTGTLFGMALLAAAAEIHVRDYEIRTFVAGIITFSQFLATILWIALTGNKKEKPIKALTDKEYIEVLPYEGGPVSGIYVAEVVEEDAPAEESAEAPVEEPATEEASAEEGAPEEASEEEQAPEGPFDAFMLTLTKEERAQFTDLYILKTVSMPEIPAYVVGGDNKKFFNKVFIFIAQYRNVIPSALLAKMYDFSMKL